MNGLRSIGIIGGAGPQAGALMFRQMIQVCQNTFGCIRDRDFPLIKLISFPFSEMLCGIPDRKKICSELMWSYNQLNADITVIACNTLHSYLDETVSMPGFYHLIKETSLQLKKKPLILCSSNSRLSTLYDRYIECSYPENQVEVDSIIDDILAGYINEKTCMRLSRLIEDGSNEEVVLACTEFSLLHDQFPILVKGKKIIDPSLIAANKICKSIFDK